VAGLAIWAWCNESEADRYMEWSFNEGDAFDFFNCSQKCVLTSWISRKFRPVSFCIMGWCVDRKVRMRQDLRSCAPILTQPPNLRVVPSPARDWTLLQFPYHIPKLWSQDIFDHHDPSITYGFIQEMRSWSPQMAMHVNVLKSDYSVTDP
jgi:hypothetical protein